MKASIAENLFFLKDRPRDPFLLEKKILCRELKGIAEEFIIKKRLIVL
jgi:hypothetical protein